MSSVRRHPSNSEWLDVAALGWSRRYARLTSLLLLGGLLLPLISLQQPRLHLPAVQPLTLTMRFHEPEIIQQPPREERRLLAQESDFAIPEAAKKKEVPPPKAFEPVVPEVPRPKPEPRERPKPKPKQTVALTAVPPQKANAAQPGGTAPAPAQAARVEASASSKQMALRVLVEEIEKRKRYPKQARRIGAQGTVVLLVRIGADGRVQSCTVDKNCGIGALDLETARLGDKLQGLDTGVRGPAFSVRVPVRYTLH